MDQLLAAGGESKLQQILDFMKAAFDQAKNVIDFQIGREIEGAAAAAFVPLTSIGVMQQRDNSDDANLARLLHHLYSIYFTNRNQTPFEFSDEEITRVLAHKPNYVQRSGGLWPEGSWITSHHRPHPSWLTDTEVTNVTGMNAHHYKNILRELGYAPLSAPTKESLDCIWRALYMPGHVHSMEGLQTSNAERYAVVSYVQCAGGHHPPATWASEVDSVLTELVEMGVITQKALWFDKLASRQYKHSQKWWGAAATMQFLFNPVIVVLPRMSEQYAFSPVVGPSIWGSDEADKIYLEYLRHAKDCEQCRASYVLRWALRQDSLLPIAALRTWPRVEHALGACGLGLFTSEITYTAITAVLTCALAMFSALLKHNRVLYDVLCDASLLPSSLIAEDGSVLLSWVHITCSSTKWHSDDVGTSMVSSLTEIATCMMDLHHLFCRMQTRKRSALVKLDSRFGRLVECRKFGLYYPHALEQPNEENEVDIPSLAWCNSNDRWAIRGIYPKMNMDTFAALQARAASYKIGKNLFIAMQLARPSISNAEFVAARHQALTVLVHSQAARAPCYAWDDKLVAAILLSSPNVFVQAYGIWQDHEKGGQSLGNLTSALRAAGVLTEDEDIDWDPNTLIATLAVQISHTVHRLVPRPNIVSQYQPVQVSPFLSANGDVRSKFAGFFLGHLPSRAWQSLQFRTVSGKKLPHMNDWVCQMLQDASLSDTNMVVVRQERVGSVEEKESAQCWHCQKLLRAGQETPGCSRAPKELLIPIACSPDDPDLANIKWGLGSFDPLNIATLDDQNHYFGMGPDAIAVLLEHIKGTRGRFHAYALAHFAILGSKAVNACTTCHAILIEERDGRAGKVVAMWTVLPMVPYKERGYFLNEISII